MSARHTAFGLAGAVFFGGAYYMGYMLTLRPPARTFPTGNGRVLVPFLYRLTSFLSRASFLSPS